MRDRCVRHRATPHGRHHAQRDLCRVVEAALRTKYTFLPCACRTRIVILRMLSRTRQMCCATNSSHLHRTVMRLCAGVTISCSRFHRSWSTIIDDYGHGMIGARLSSSTFGRDPLCLLSGAHADPTTSSALPGRAGDETEGEVGERVAHNTLDVASAACARIADSGVVAGCLCAPLRFASLDGLPT